LHGEVFETDLPERPRSYTNITYSLDHIELRTLVFKSTKSEIRRNILLQEIEAKREAKLLKKTKSLERLREENPGVEIDEQTFLEDSDTEEELEDLYIPPIANPVLWLQYTPRDTIWLSMGGYDAGYVYEFEFESEHPVQCTMVPHGDGIEIHSYLYL
jgi:cilia- and flagella-associated protein 44